MPRNLIHLRSEINQLKRISPVITQYQGSLRSKRDEFIHVKSENNFTLHNSCRAAFSRPQCIRCSLGQASEGGSVSQKNSHENNTDTQKETNSLLQHSLKFAKRIIKHFVRVLVSLLIFFTLTIAGAPTFLSSSQCLHAVVALVNKAIPGHVNVHSASLGWSKPVVLERISLKGINGEVVLSVMKVETKASLWALVRGKAGFGDCTIVCPRVDLQEEKGSGLLNLALALAPASRLLHSQHRRKLHSQLTKKNVASAVDVALSVDVKAPSGGLKITDGKLIVPYDIAAALGHRVFVDVLLGHWAVEKDEDLKKAYQRSRGSWPLKADLWSASAQAEAVGLIDLRKQRVELVRSMKVEMDLSAAVGQLYLARINPLLGEVVGPAVQDEDLPDVVLYVLPENMVLPAENFSLRLEPMKAVFARGPLAGGILGLLSREKEGIARGMKEVIVQTSPIEAQVKMDGTLKCLRIDLLIAGKVAVATWGVMDWIEESVKMTIAVPSTTFKDVFGLELPRGFNLKIPVGGTFEHPQVDWKAAAVGVAQLSLMQRGGRYVMDLFAFFDEKASVPEPIAIIPWLNHDVPKVANSHNKQT